MAKFVLNDASVVIDSVDLSDHVESVSLSYSADMVEVTCMGATGHEYAAGLVNGTLTLTFRQDFDADSVDATLFALVGAAGVTCVVKPTSSAVGATNPTFTGTALLSDYSGPVDGSVGSAANASATFQVSGAIARATA